MNTENTDKREYIVSVHGTFLAAVSTIAAGRGVVRVTDATKQQYQRHVDDFCQRNGAADVDDTDWSVVAAPDGVVYGVVGTLHNAMGDATRSVAYADASL